MPDRPRNGGPEDGPDYTWLYGKGGSPQRPDETRVMRAQPRPGVERRGGARPTPPPADPPSDPPAAGPTGPVVGPATGPATGRQGAQAAPVPGPVRVRAPAAVA